MANETFGWIDVEKSDRLIEFGHSNNLPKIALPKKVSFNEKKGSRNLILFYLNLRLTIYRH